MYLPSIPAAASAGVGPEPVKRYRRSRRGTAAPPQRLQRGQALTEMAVLAVILLPLMVLIPLLGKYLHARHQVQMATRAAAWEATVAPDYEVRGMNRAVEEQRLIERYFADPNLPIQTQLVGGDPEDPLGDPMFNTFSNRPLVERADVELSPYEHAAASGLFGFIPNQIPLPRDSGGNLNGLVKAELVVRLQNLRYADGSAASFFAPFDAIDLSLSSEHTLLVDTWNARGSGGRCQDCGPGWANNSIHHRSVLGQVRIFAPLANVGFVANALSTIYPLLSFIPGWGALNTLDLQIARDRVDIVPRDKLEPRP